MATFEDELAAGSRKSNSLQEPLLKGVKEASVWKENENVTAFSTAGLFSLATFSWLNPLLALGYRKHLNIEDVPVLVPQDRGREAQESFTKTRRRLKDEHPERPPSISLALIRTFWVSMVATGVGAALTTVSSYVGPYLINDFVEFLGGRRRFPMEGYVLVAGFCIAGIVNCLADCHYHLGIYRLGVRVRACLTATLYEKSLRLSSSSRKHRTSGEIINYMAVDVERIIEFLWWIHDFWILPLQVSLGLAILYKNVGLTAAVAALIATVATVLLNVPLATLETKFQEQLMGAKDARMKTTSECLRNMRILKLQAWESEFLSQIEKLRATEYKYLARNLYIVAVSTFLLWTSPAIVAIATFTTCVLLGVPLTPGRVLSTTATLLVLRMPLQNLSDFVAILAQAKVSLHRLLLFSQEPELLTDTVVRGSDFELHDCAIEVENGTFSWHTDVGEEMIPPTLRGVNLRVRKGAHVAVCGPVGSGKSALLSCMLGEIPKVEGRVRVEGLTAYVAQTPWIQSGTFKENICFGRPMDEALYERVLQACDLKKDIAMFPFGDDTGIGERGINLSGGQKQRVQLARALYQEADVYFLDDPFSAVDAHTGSHLLKECMMGMLASKTVVYVTHKMESLPIADHIVVLRDGVIVQAGKFEDLLQNGTDFSTLILAHNEALENMQTNMNIWKDAEMSDNSDKFVEKTKSEISNQQNNDGTGTDHEKNTTRLQQLVKEEERERGQVSYKVYWVYATAIAGGAFIPLYLFSAIGFQAFQILSNYWMAWGTSSTEGDSWQVSTKKLILVYVLLAFSGSFCMLLRAMTISIIGLKTAQKYFLKMLRSIFRAPMSFFDSTPSGRILTRMSADQSSMDLEVQFSMSRFTNAFLQLMAIITIMSMVAWQILLLMIPIVVTCILFQRYYIASARELARLTNIQKSPIVNYYGESIAGATTIRGFHQEERFMATNLDKIDNFARAYFHKSTSREWLVMRMQLLSVFAFTCVQLFVVTVPQVSSSPSLVGVAVTYGLTLSSALVRLIWNASQLETTVVAVERILQYCSLPTEPPLVIENARPAHNWPSQGTVEIHNLQVRYNAHSPLVLHGVSCTFRGGEKVGIVGRTGSGKSTLIQALFRAVEPVGGRIEIDKLDISTIGLHDLRSSLSIIPQDPTLFEGSMRINLDPLGKYSDAQIWEALDKCQLGDIVRAKEQRLEAPVSENGENWSVGQRQLVCLGRALLKQTRILVLDEATASVDSATDALIQQTLRSEFRACTVITVAHRIPTIVDSDKVLVLDKGRVVEHNSPAMLLQDQSSFFSKLVMEYSM